MWRLARWRVPLGFACGLAVLWLATPTWRTIGLGLVVAAAGHALRLWAAGHLEKNREVTRSGPYRYVQHPLYAGSTLIGVGLAVAAGRLAVAAIVFTYLLVTLSAAVRTERASLAGRFGETYHDYVAGRAAGSVRRFSWVRVGANREHRALVGGLLVVALLVAKLLFR
jgi:protein-S-isoprenylcysteine O-methyltransferase Ste14